MDYAFAAGCGVFVNDGLGIEDEHWRNWRSFFAEIDGFLKIKISDYGYRK